MTSLILAPTRGHDDALASPRLAGALYAALVALAAAPAWLWPIPRANDIVNHWARLTLYGMAADDPLRALYRVQFGLIPNLGLDALYLALQPFASAQTVTRLALALAIALPALGAWALHRALFAKPSPTIWAIPFLSYNVATTGGLLNFSIGMGLAFLALAVIARRGERLGWREALALNLFGVALFFCHLIAWGAFALLFGLMRVACPPARLRRGAYLVAAQLAPLALVALRQAPPSTYSLGGTKLGILFAPVASMTGSDLTALTLLVAGAALAVVLGLRPAPQARAALAGFALVTLLAPPALGAASLIDARLAVYLCISPLRRVGSTPPGRFAVSARWRRSRLRPGGCTPSRRPGRRFRSGGRKCARGLHRCRKAPARWWWRLSVAARPISRCSAISPLSRSSIGALMSTRCSRRPAFSLRPRPILRSTAGQRCPWTRAG